MTKELKGDFAGSRGNFYLATQPRSSGNEVCAVFLLSDRILSVIDPAGFGRAFGQRHQRQSICRTATWQGSESAEQDNQCSAVASPLFEDSSNDEHATQLNAYGTSGRHQQEHCTRCITRCMMWPALLMGRDRHVPEQDDIKSMCQYVTHIPSLSLRICSACGFPTERKMQTRAPFKGVVHSLF